MAYLMAIHFWTMLDRDANRGMLLMLRLTHCCVKNWEQHKRVKLFFNETECRTSFVMLSLCAELELLDHNIQKLSRSAFRSPPQSNWNLIFCKVKQHMFIVVYQHFITCKQYKKTSWTAWLLRMWLIGWPEMAEKKQPTFAVKHPWRMKDSSYLHCP